MNALTRDMSAESDERSEAEALDRDGAPVTVVSSFWLDGDVHPPSLELVLSDGTFVQLRWDISYATRNVLRARNEHEDFADCTGDETGLSADLLWEFVQQVEAAVTQWDAEGGSHDVRPGDEGVC